MCWKAWSLHHLRAGGEANGHLVTRWTNEELLLSGQVLNQALIAALFSESGDDADADSGVRGIILRRIEHKQKSDQTTQLSNLIDTF
jgi:hypothetical protein